MGGLGRLLSTSGLSQGVFFYLTPFRVSKQVILNDGLLEISINIIFPGFRWMLKALCLGNFRLWFYYRLRLCV